MHHKKGYPNSIRWGWLAKAEATCRLNCTSWALLQPLQLMVLSQAPGTQKWLLGKDGPHGCSSTCQLGRLVGPLGFFFWLQLGRWGISWNLLYKGMPWLFTIWIWQGCRHSSGRWDACWGPSSCIHSEGIYIYAFICIYIHYFAMMLAGDAVQCLKPVLWHHGVTMSHHIGSIFTTALCYYTPRFSTYTTRQWTVY